jgi:hypothetical protein
MEWFMRVWYENDSVKVIVAVARKKTKMIRSQAAALGKWAVMRFSM